MGSGDDRAPGTGTTGDGRSADGTRGLRRRRLLRSAGLAVGGLSTVAGCTGSDEGCPDVVVEGPDGQNRCVAPVEDDRTVAEYYGFDESGDRSANLPTVLAGDATVTFVYRDGSTGERSLVLVHGAPESEAGGAAVVTVEGAGGATWRVQDGPPGNDAYATPDGEVGATETAVWSWPAGRSDGGALGALGDGFDVTVTHRAQGAVGGESGQRDGLGRWLLVDGADPESPIELATFDGGDVAVELSDGGG